MTYLKLEISGRRLQNRAEEEWMKIEYFNPVKSKHGEGDDWVEFDGDDYFTQLQFYVKRTDRLIVKYVIGTKGLLLHYEGREDVVTMMVTKDVKKVHKPL